MSLMISDSETIVTSEGPQGPPGPAGFLTAGIASLALGVGVATFVTTGYAVAGDNGHGQYATAASNPGAPGAVQMADSRWAYAINGTVRPEQFGYAHGQTTDQTALVQKAIDLCTWRALGGAVELPADVGCVNGLVLKSNVRLIGQGMLRTSLQKIGAVSTTGQVYLAPGATNVEISDLAIDGLSDLTQAASLLRLGDHGNRIRINRVRFVNGMGRWALRSDLATTAAFGVSVTNCRFENCPLGGLLFLPQIAGLTDVEISHNVFDGVGNNICGIHGIWGADYCFDVRVLHNTIINCLNTGTHGAIPFEFWGINGFDLSHNYVRSATRGLSVMAHGFRVANNYLEGQTAYGAECTTSRDGVICDNVFNGCASGIYWDGEVGSTIGGVPTPWIDGGDIYNVDIHNNHFIGSGMAAYNSTSPSSAIQVVNTGAGVLQVAKNLNIHHNHFWDCEFQRRVIDVNVSQAAPTFTLAGDGVGAGVAAYTLQGVPGVNGNAGFATSGLGLGGRVLKRGQFYSTAPAVTPIGGSPTSTGAWYTTIDAAGHLTGVVCDTPGSYGSLPELQLSGGGASFTGALVSNGSVANTSNLTVTACTGIVLSGQVLAGAAVPYGLSIASQISGSPGGVGVYLVIGPATVSAEAMTSQGFGGKIEASMAIGSVTLSGGTGYSALSITAAGNGGYGFAATAAISGGVPGAVTVTNGGGGFGRASNCQINDNVIYGRTFNSCLIAINVSGAEGEVKRNKIKRTADIDTGQYNGASAVFINVAAQANSAGNPAWDISDNLIEMRGAIGGGMTLAAIGANLAPQPMYGLTIERNRLRGNFSYGVLLPDTSGTARVLDNDTTGMTAGTPYSLNAAVTYRQITARYSGTAAPTVGAYRLGDIVVNEGASIGQPWGWQCIAAGSPGSWQPLSAGGNPPLTLGYVPLSAYGAGGTQVTLAGARNFNPSELKIRCNQTTPGAAQPTCIIKITWAGRLNDAPTGGVVQLNYGSYNAPTAAPFVMQQGGAVTVASGTDGSGRMETALFFPLTASATMTYLIEVIADSNADLAQFSIDSSTTGTLP